MPALIHPDLPPILEPVTQLLRRPLFVSFRFRVLQQLLLHLEQLRVKLLVWIFLQPQRWLLLLPVGLLQQLTLVALKAW